MLKTKSFCMSIHASSRPFIRTTWPLLAVFAISAIVLFSLLYWLMSSYVMGQVDARLFREVQQFSHAPRQRTLAQIAAFGKREAARIRPYGMFDTDRRWLAGNIVTLPHERENRPFDYIQHFDANRHPEVGHFRGIITPLPSGELVVIGQSIDDEIRFQRLVLTTAGAGLALTIILGLSCGAALNAQSNRRIKEIAAASKYIMSGHLERRLPTRGSQDDVDRLAVIVNGMLDEIERLVMEVKNVCAGIAHELRTPMTRLRAGLERMHRRSVDLSAYQAGVDAAIEQADVVLERFAALLRIAEIEAGDRRATFRRLDLRTIVTDVYELYEPLAEQRGIRLALGLDDCATVLGDPDLLFGAIENLVDNALKFTPAGGSVTMALTLHEGQPRLQIADTGPGIHRDEREAVLRPFYRCQQALTLPARGHGLGLSLVVTIARVHGADLVISDNLPGCRVSLLFNLT